MNRRRLRLALALYPRAWRRARGEELAQLVDDLLADGEPPLAVGASLLWGALREQVRPTYLRGRRAVGLGATVVAGAVVAVAVVTVVGHGGHDLIPATALSTSSVATPGGMERILFAQHVTVSVDGTAEPLAQIAGGSVGFAPSATTRTVSLPRLEPGATVPTTPGSALGPGDVVAPVFRFSPLVAIKRAIAYQVLTDLVSRDAERHGRVATPAAARAYAEREYAAWRAHPVPLPHGAGPSTFLSPRAVDGYRHMLTVDDELDRIAGPVEGDRTPALERWMTGQLRSNTVTVTGVPGLAVDALAGSLPPHL